MYIQNLFAETEQNKLRKIIQSVCFGTLILQDGERSDANHIPFEFVDNKDNLGLLRAHVSKQSTCCNIAKSNNNALVTFLGPNTYISPSWMPGSETHRKVAPSWNYAAVHVYGKIRLIDDAKWITKHIARLTANLESRREHPWKFKDANPTFVQAMPGYITGLEITITDIQGKFQASQQYSERTRRGIQEGILNECGEIGESVNKMITERNEKKE